ncbi:hypothetical protein J2X87_003630 [Pseudomonas synxantha]|uniref:Uncharacterized protein n=1 Tax=Pseudomonas synxantha TaxID=47883 RepID=A0ACC6JQJ6_9PSED|nr:hypothetical protein [Pseudomonas synxantha]
MVAGIWFHWMSESDLRRVISPGGVLVLQMTVAVAYRPISLSQADTRLIRKV